MNSITVVLHFFKGTSDYDVLLFARSLSNLSYTYDTHLDLVFVRAGKSFDVRFSPVPVPTHQGMVTAWAIMDQLSTRDLTEIQDSLDRWRDEKAHIIYNLDLKREVLSIKSFLNKLDSLSRAYENVVSHEMWKFVRVISTG